MGVVKLSTAGILDYQKYSSALAGNSPYIPFISDFDLLETVETGASVSSVTFSSLNSTYGSDYQHLQLRLVMQDTDALSNTQNLFLKLNGGTGSRTHYLEGDGSTVSSDTKTDSYIRVRSGFTKGGDTYGFSVSVIDILDAFDTSKNKTVRYLSGAYALNANGVALGSGFRSDTTALDTITLDGNDAINTGSRMSLYGLKGN